MRDLEGDYLDEVTRDEGARGAFDASRSSIRHDEDLVLGRIAHVIVAGRL